MKERQSNMELLRILSMMAVIMVHLDGASIGLPTPHSLTDINAPDLWRIVVESITIVGVNCFTLISGYFGIRARLRGLLMFTLTCVVYSVAIYTAASVAKPSMFSWQQWFESWMVFTHTDLWYVPAYLILYLLSPMLNAAVDSLSLRQFRMWLGLFVLFNVWGGWFWGGNFNPTGYTPLQLIMMYLVGRYIAFEKDNLSKRPIFTRSVSATVWVCSTFLTSLLAVWLEPTSVYAYNSPWVIISSVALFIFFTTLSIQSHTINQLAKGAFAAYLIHKNPIVWGGILRPSAVMIWAKGSLTLYTIFSIGATLVIYLLSSVADTLRRWLFSLIRQGKPMSGNEVKV